MSSFIKVLLSKLLNVCKMFVFYNGRDKSKRCILFFLNEIKLKCCQLPEARAEIFKIKRHTQTVQNIV